MLRAENCAAANIIVLRWVCVPKELKSIKTTAGFAPVWDFFIAEVALSQKTWVFLYSILEFSQHSFRMHKPLSFQKLVACVARNLKLETLFTMSCGISIIYKNSPLHYKTNFIGWLIADTKTSQGICGKDQNLEGIHSN